MKCLVLRLTAFLVLFLFIFDFYGFLWSIIVRLVFSSMCLFMSSNVQFMHLSIKWFWFFNLKYGLEMRSFCWVNRSLLLLFRVMLLNSLSMCGVWLDLTIFSLCLTLFSKTLLSFLLVFSMPFQFLKIYLVMMITTQSSA